MAQAGGLVPSRGAARRRAHRRLRGALLLRATSPSGRPAHGRLAALHLERRVRGAAREARRARTPARRRVPGARRREPARRPRGGGPVRRRLLRQEHAADHAPARLLGRARHARHDVGDRADAAARARLRLVPPLHRRLPHRCARRAGRARLDALPLVLDAGARADPRGVPRRARRAGLRLRHLPGRLPVEPRDREAPRRAVAARGGDAARQPRRVARGGRRAARASGSSGSTCRGTIRAGCAATRSSRRATSAARSSGRRSSATPRARTSCSREHAEWALGRLDAAER